MSKGEELKAKSVPRFDICQEECKMTPNNLLCFDKVSIFASSKDLKSNGIVIICN